jgi:hypothetical protein
MVPSFRGEPGDRLLLHEPQHLSWSAPLQRSQATTARTRLRSSSLTRRLIDLLGIRSTCPQVPVQLLLKEASSAGVQVGELLDLSEERGPVERDEHLHPVEAELTFFDQLASEDQNCRCVADSDEDSPD